VLVIAIKQKDVFVKNHSQERNVKLAYLNVNQRLNLAMVMVYVILYMDANALKDGVEIIVKQIKMLVLYSQLMNNAQDLVYVMKRKVVFVQMASVGIIVKKKEMIAEQVHLVVLEEADVIKKKENVNVRVDSKEVYVN